MNLVIDIGNTFIKLGIFEKSSLLYKESIAHRDLHKAIPKISKEYPFLKKAIVSSVSNINEKDMQVVFDFFDPMILDHNIKMPFKNLYQTPATLGVDRLALVAAAVDQFPQKHTLIIDAGTCITYDFKNSKEEYLGGAISPGLRLRYVSLNNYTAKLPLLDLKEPKNHIGDSTTEAIHAGVVLGVLYEIEGIIAQYCNIYPDLTVILTGGDADFLSKRLKNSIFATSNFLLEGLNYILAFNNSQ